MNIEKLIISKAILGEQYIQKFINAGITPLLFQNKTAQEIYTYITKTRKEQGYIPSSKELNTLYKFIPDPDTSQYNVVFIVEEFKRYFKRSTLTQILAESAKLADDPDEAGKIIHKYLSEIRTQFAVARDVDLSKSVPNVLKACHDALMKGGVTGLKTPWKELDKAIGGFNPEEFALILGRPKTGKTWFALYMASECVKNGMTVLFVSKEMSQRLLERRYIGLRAGVPYNELKSGKLTTQSKFKMNILANKLKNESGKFILIEDDTSADTGVAFIDSKVEEYKPDIVFIDGVYLLADDGGATDERPRLRAISRDCKRMAHRRKVPIVAVLQMNRDKVSKSTGEGGMNAVYGTDGFIQDTDWAAEIIRNKELDDEQCRLFKIVAAREGENLSMKIPFNLDRYSFNQVFDSSNEEAPEEGEVTLR